MIKRPDYINEISKFIDVPLVKILAGVRRCGKSTILDMMKEELLARGVRSECIISRKYNEIEKFKFSLPNIIFMYFSKNNSK